MKWFVPVIALLSLILVQIPASSQSDCVAEIKGKKYDLSPLRNNTGNYVIPKSATGKWTIYMNVCGPLVQAPCPPPSSGCQQYTGGQISIGSDTARTYNPPNVPGKNGYGLTIQYTGGDGGRKMEIDFTCDPTAGIGAPTWVDENPALHYNFEWKSQYACPVGGLGGGGGGLSGGSIFLILVLCLTVTYIVGGVVVNKFVRHQDGIALLPNVEFWKGVFGLTKDGVMFIFRKITGRSAYQQV